MKTALCALGLCVAALVAVSGQDRGFDRGGARGRPPSRVLTAIDADRDGTISGAEIAASPAALRQLDANGDGQLTAEELRPPPGTDGRRRSSPGSEAGREGRPQPGSAGPAPGAGGGTPPPGTAAPASADDLADTLMSFDRNGDGSLARAEVPDRFQGLFDRADADKDGALTRDELKQSATTSVQQATSGGRGGRGPMADPIVRVLDADRDGLVSAAELAGAPDALLSLDANKDGQVTRDEYRPAGALTGRDGERR